MMHVDLVFWTIRWMSGGYHLEKQAVAFSSWACCTKGLRCNIFLYWPNDIPQESFEIPRGQSSREGDIELGERGLQNSGELGLENFFKKVALVCSLCKRDVNVTNFFCSSLFLPFFYILFFCMWNLIHIWFDSIKQTIFLFLSFSRFRRLKNKMTSLTCNSKNSRYLLVLFSYSWLFCGQETCNWCLTNQFLKERKHNQGLLHARRGSPLSCGIEPTRNASVTECLGSMML